MGPPSHPNLLLLSAGSKVAIARIAHAAAQRRGAELLATDTTAQVPARPFVDAFHTLPPSDHPDWPDALAQLCRQRRVGLVVPTRHADLLPLARLKPTLLDHGTDAAVSSPETILACIQKRDTYALFRKLGLPTPETVVKRERAASPLAERFPLFAKPASGSASVGARLVRNASELESVPDDWILQECVEGLEYTANLYLDRHGQLLCAIPHQRLVVQDGEVAQARVERLEPLIQACRAVAENLPGAAGILNLQAFYQPERQRLALIEINPRIGGGYPLCDAAKGRFIEWLCQEYLDGDAPKPFDRWTDNLLMMRYREAVFEL